MLTRRCLALLLAALLVAVLLLVPASAASAVPLPEAWGAESAGRFRHSSPVIADVDGDGTNEIVIGALDGLVRVLRANGTPLPGWPQRVILPGASAPTAVESSPAVADLDRDGALEVIVGAGSIDAPNQQGGVVVFDRRGGVRCRYLAIDHWSVWAGRPGPDGFAEPVFSSPAVGDVDGDGFRDIVFGSWDHRVHAINRGCVPVSGFPYNSFDTVWSSPALFDSDRDGRLEIFIGSDSSAGSGPENWAGGVFRALDWSGGKVRQLWKRRPAEIIQSSPAIGDIDGDGRVEAVVGAGVFYRTADSNRVYAYHLDDGSDVPGWPRSTGGHTFSSPALGDLTGDGRPEVAVASRDGRVHTWRGNGTPHWNVAIGGGESIASPVIADLDGNGRQDVAVGNGAHTVLLDGLDGHQLVDPVQRGWAHQNAPAVGNFGASGWRLVVAGYKPSTGRGRIASLPIPAPGRVADWPVFRKDSRHIAAPPSGSDLFGPGRCGPDRNPRPAPSDASARGYWVLGGDGGVFSFGDARFHGSLPSRGIRTRAISIDATPAGDGYWVLGEDGGVFSFGGARFFGSMAGRRLRARIIALEPTPTGRGYWLLGADGGIFNFGDARFFGSTGNLRLAAPVVAMAATPTGRGYYLLGGDGGVFNFGDAVFRGSTGGRRLSAPVISMAVSPKGSGYWLLGADGGIFSFGVRFWGSVPGIGLCAASRTIQLRATSTGQGYWLLGIDGGIFSFGDARFRGSFPGLTGSRAAVDLTIRR